jgi:protoheme ferro-lyase
MKRIYHHYKFWEDYPAGFYENMSGSVKEEKIKKVIEMFNSEELTSEFMNRVIDEWKYSCEQNLTNESINKIAYIGQAACCLYDRIPSTVTMEAWSLLSKEVQDRSDKIALEIISKWESQNKFIQLCLNII